MDPIEAFLPRWHRIVAERDLAALAEVLSPDVTMSAPPYWQPFDDRETVHHLLGIIIHTIEDFTYHREWQHGSELALEFRGHIGDHDLQGIDLISLDAEGRVENLDVMIRPMNVLEELRAIVQPQMLAYLKQRAEPA